jgi:hypothetical protein
MPLQSYKFAAGFDKQSTEYGAEGKWVDGENVRFRYGQPEKIGGWIKLITDKIYGAVRAQFAWSSLDGTRYLAIGTDKKLYVYTEGAISDITPLRATESNLTNPFVTTSGSAIVTVTDAGHGAKAGDFVTFSNADAVGGLDMNAEFEITSVTSSSVYTVTHSSNASSGATGGGSSTVDVEYQLSVGEEVNTYGYGWGIDPWNGLASTGRVTDQLNEVLDTTETGVDVDDGSKFANGDYILIDQEIMKVTGVSSNTLTVTRQLTTNEGTTTVSAGSHDAAAHADNTVVTIIFDASNTTINATSWNEAASSSTTILDSRYWVFENFGEDLLCLQSNGSLFRWDTSSGVTTRAVVASANAPTASRHLILSTPDRHVILMGTETTIGTTTSKDDLFLRFSSQEDFTTWSPTSTNTAGSFRIQDGSKIITTLRSRGGILIWTDTSLHQLQFIGPPFIFGLSQLASNCGAVSPYAAVDVNGTTFWMSQQSFYMFDGAVKKIPCSVQDYVFDDFSITQQPLVYAGLNSDFNEITWFYASKDSDFIDRNVTYNYVEGTWYTNSLARTTWLDYGVYQVPYATEYNPTVTGDSPTVLGATDGSSVIYQHEEGTDNDIEAMECFLQSGDFDIQDGEDVLSISRYIPDFKNQKGSANVLLTFKDFSQTTTTDSLKTAISSSLSGTSAEINLKDSSNFPTTDGSILIGTEIIAYSTNNATLNKLIGITRAQNGTTATSHSSNKKVTNYTNTRINLSTVTPTTTKVDTRGRGRQANVVISSTAVGDKWRYGTLRLDVKPDGNR